MNKIKRTGMLVIALLLSVAMMLSACGGEAPAVTETEAPDAPAVNSGEVLYSVSVVDALGTPWADGVIVRFMSGDQQAAMQVVANGVAEKALPAGEYTVELMFTDDNGQYYYDQEGLTLTAEQSSLEIALTFVPTEEARNLTINDKEYAAYPVHDGGTYVDLVAGERNYFLFAPTQAGTYEISMQGDAEKIGYYGSTFFVQNESLVEVVDNTFTVSIRADMIGTDGTGTTVMVLGIDAGSADHCTLTIERIGDPEWTIEDEPWVIYQPTVKLAPYTLSSKASLREFDLTASTGTYNLVLDSEGFYHLDSEDGPLVVVMLGVNGKYLDCFKNILDRSGVSKYFFDEEGNFLKRENYTDCLNQYLAVMDENTGVYPLTEDLKYIIQQRGDHSGWYDPENKSYLFVDDNRVPIDGINNEISWLFMCRYTETY